MANNTINNATVTLDYQNGIANWDTFDKVPHKEEWAKPMLKACEKAYKSLTFYAKYYGVDDELAGKYYGFCVEHLATIQDIAGLPKTDMDIAMLFALFGIRQGKVPKSDSYTLKVTTMPTFKKSVIRLHKANLAKEQACLVKDYSEKAKTQKIKITTIKDKLLELSALGQTDTEEYKTLVQAYKEHLVKKAKKQAKKVA